MFRYGKYFSGLRLASLCGVLPLVLVRFLFDRSIFVLGGGGVV